jgi:hypothetical protein
MPLADNQKTLIYWTKQKRSRTARGSIPHRKRAARRFQVTDDLGQLAERVGIDRVVHPPSFFAIVQQAGVFEHAKMERQPGLSSIKLVLQLANAPLALLEHLQHGEARFVRERVEKLNGSSRVCRYGHVRNVSTSVDMSSQRSAWRNDPIAKPLPNIGMGTGDRPWE